MGIFGIVNSPSGIRSKSTDKLKSMMSLREGTADDREEGEIIDEYEDIISSDEEFSMRQRIEELEAKNAELEKIANISAIYANGSYDYTKKEPSNHHVDRYPLISIDISDEEDYPPAPPMTRTTKRRKSLQHSSSRRKLLHATSNSSHRRRKMSSSPPPAPSYRPSDKMLLSMFHEKYARRSSSKKRRKNKKSHSNKTPRRLREYQYVSDDYTLDTYNLNVEDGYENYNSSDADASFSINRDELRLALARNTHHHEQHVSLKDRLIRRKENTDTLNGKNEGDEEEIVEVEDNSDCPQDKSDTEDNMEEQELRIIALKSAVIRKHLVRKKRNENIAYSPSDFDETYANISVSSPINIDDAEPCMEISPVPSPRIVISDDDEIDTKPVDMDIANSDSDCELPYEKWVPIEQIPLPNNMMMPDELYVPTPLRYDANVEHQHFASADVRFEPTLESPVNLESDVEEEELALRALLLAKMNSPRVNKNPVQERVRVEERHSSDADTSLEAEALRNFLISNMKKKTEPRDSSASVLKEAVRRLTARNTSASPMQGMVELPPNQGKCQSVGTFKMTLHDTENQLCQSTADFAKIQIGNGDIRENKVTHAWSMWNVDENCSDIKFYLSPEEIKAEKKELTEQNERGDFEEETKPEYALIEGLADDIIEENVERSYSKKEIEEVCKPLTPEAVCDSKELICDESGGKDVTSESELPETKSDLRVPKIGDTTSAESENHSDSNKTTQEQVLNQGNLEGSLNENEQVEEQSDEKVSPLKDGSMIKDSSPEQKASPEEQLAEKAKEEESKVDISQATNAEVNVEKNVTKECENSQENEVQSSDKTQQADPTTAASKGMLISVEDEHESSGLNTSSVPKETATEAKKKLPLNVSRVGKSLIARNQSKAISPSTPHKKTDTSNGLEIKKAVPLTAAKQGKENTAIKNASAGKIQSKVEQSEKTLTKSAVTTKSSTIVQSTKRPHPSSSIKQPTKIVKPNKVINTRVNDGKRAPADNVVKPPAKKAKLEESTNRLITAAEMPQVKKLVIELRASDTESEYSALSPDGDDDEFDLDAREKDLMNQSITVGNEYYDISSPISLPMESPCDTPTRTASPITSVTPQTVVEKSIVNDFFEAQLDKFLKNVRSKVTESSKQAVSTEEPPSPVVRTPVAVRHLPEASQQEYRRLINRMKMLERQKQAKNLQVIVKNPTVVATSETRTVIGENESLVRKVLVKNASVNTAKPTCPVKIPSRQSSQKPNVVEGVELTSPATADEAQKLKTTGIAEQSNSAIAHQTNVTLSALPMPSPSKSVAKSIPTAAQKAASLTTKQSNEKLLVSYEKTYRETGNSIISNLDKSIEMVMVAKRAKMEKLKHEHRLMVLQKEMEEVQRHIREHQNRITKIYPEICNSHRLIETLKTRRMKIHKDITAFGKRVIGQSYSMKNDQKPIISEKSKKLAEEIKLVNNMKLSDVEKWQDHHSPPQTIIPSVVAPQVQMPTIETNSLTCPSDNRLPVDNNKTKSIEPSLPKAASSLQPEQTFTDVPEKTMNEPDKGDDRTEQNQKNSTIGHEEALENESPVDGDKQEYNAKDSGEKDGNLNETLENQRDVNESKHVGVTELQEYVSPLGHMRDKRQINPNGIVCPYQLMGQCGDKDCKYMHLDN